LWIGPLVPSIFSDNCSTKAVKKMKTFFLSYSAFSVCKSEDNVMKTWLRWGEENVVESIGKLFIPNRQQRGWMSWPSFDRSVFLNKLYRRCFTMHRRDVIQGVVWTHKTPHCYITWRENNGHVTKMIQNKMKNCRWMGRGDNWLFL